MARQWDPNGSHADYWRSDNPLIGAWYRFGDDLPKNAFLSNEEKDSPTVYLSGLMKDSGPCKHHLKPYFLTGTDETVLTPVPGIAPWALSGSGLQFNQTYPDNKMLYADPAYVIHNRDGVTDHGTLSNGVNMYSGITVIGWARIPDAGGPQGAQTILGRADQDTSLSTHLLWRIVWSQPTSTSFVFASTFLSQTNFTFNGTGTFPATRVLQGNTLSSATSPNFPTDRSLPFFFALQYSREEVEDNRSFTGNGSGIARIFVGTEASGISAVQENLYRGPDIDCTYINPDRGGVPLSIFSESRPLRGATTNRHLVDGAVLDEVVIVNDGMMSPERILHYALSGMTKIDTSDPEHPDFEVEFPQSSGLQAYWGFEDNGNNTSPNTLNDPRLELSLSGLGSSYDFADGVNGGRCIRVSPANAMNTASDGELLLARNDYPLIPAVSGLPLLFPSGHVVDEGMTVIGWMRPIPTGTIANGGFGWIGANGRHNSFFIDNNATAGSVGLNSLSVSAYPSGQTALLEHIRVTSDESVSATLQPGNGLGTTTSTGIFNSEYDVADDGWHLWAGVWDFKAGTIYLVKDAKHVIPMTQAMSSTSGLSSDGLGPWEGFFGFVPRGTNSVEYDDFAVYNRVLSIPEMSGFGLANIQGPPIQTDIDTSFRSLVGYWPLADVTNYDPVGISGYRLNDESWYFHHLTNISGLFSFDGDSLNTEVSEFPTSTEVNVSGSMISLERVLHGSNLDASNSNLFAASGFSAGAWVYLPSGDLQTQGNGSSGLYGTHMIMGAWGPEDNERSWFMGIEGNKLAVKFVESNETPNEFTSTLEPTYNQPFFVGCNFFPSGSSLVAQMVKIDSSSTAPTQYAIDSTFASPSITPRSVGASGFSILNAPGRGWGFPSGTRMQHAFMHLGHLNEDRWQRVKRDAIRINTLASGAVSTTDPDNISHWNFDKAGSEILDVGKEQNHLSIFNTDGHDIGVEAAIHSSGVVVRKPEYLDTRPDNAQSRRLDLGSGTQSWTALTWLIPPVISNTDEHVILNKGSGPAASPTGIKVFTDADSLTAQALAADKTTAGNNGDLAPSEWNHLAVTYDRDNNEFGVVINGRYAGTSFVDLIEIEPNNSGLSLGGRGDAGFDANAGGSAFSGLLDDAMLFSRVLTLPEISGLAANSYNYNNQAGAVNGLFGGWISGIPQNVISGLIGSYMHGQAQDIELIAGYVSGVSGIVGEYGGFIHGSAQISGLTAAFLHGAEQQSGVFGHFMHGLDIASGLLGSYTFGACEAQDEFDVTLTFEIITSKDFDARLGVEKTEIYDFDSRLGVIRITEPPECTLEMPLIGTIASGIPYTLTVEGSGIAQDNKNVEKVRFTFADFKGAVDGTLIDGVPFSGLYQASRTFDTPGWYTVKMEVLDSYGYRTSCARPFLLIPSGSTSGAYIATLPGVSISGTPDTGSAIQRVFLTHTLTGLDNTSGVLEYTYFSDQQESLVNSLEMPPGTQFTDFVRTHDYTMPGRYTPVWAVSGSWGIVSDSLSDGIDYQV